jgi:DNA-binding CsgD family transcriptional regulator
MFERFTDRARRVVVLAQEEARMLNHNYIGTEHILVGLIHEGEGAAAKALESLGIGLEAVRQQVEEIIGQGQQAPSGPIPFTPRVKKVLELSLREALQLGHQYIGTEHILLGLIREGEGVAAQVLVKLGADLNRVRQQVIQLLHGYQVGEPVYGYQVGEPEGMPAALGEGELLSRVTARVDAIDSRLAAIEQRVGTGPDTSGLDEQIARVRAERQAAADADLLMTLTPREREVLAHLAQGTGRHDDVAKRMHLSPNMVRSHLQNLMGKLEVHTTLEAVALARRARIRDVPSQAYERAAALRDREQQLLADKAALQDEWAAEHPALPSVAEQCQQLSGEIERLRGLLRRHGIDPEDEPA